MSSPNPYASPTSNAPATPRPSHVRFVVILWLSGLAAIAYTQRSINAVEEAIRNDLGISAYWMGWAMSSFFITYGVFQLPAGWLADRWGNRNTLVLASVVSSLGTAIVAIAGGTASLFIGRLGLGLGQAGIFPAATNATACWFPRHERGAASGVLGGSMSAGGAAASALAGWLFAYWDWRWRWIVILFAVPGLLWAWWFGRWFRDAPADHPSVNPQELAAIGGEAAEQASTTKLREPTPWRKLLTSPSMWLINAQQFCRAAGYVFFITWFTTYLRQSRHVSIEGAGLLTSLPLLAVVVGSPLGGVLSDWLMKRTGSRWWGRNAVAAASMLLCAVLIAASYFIDSALTAVLVISTGSLFAAIGGPVAYAITIDMGGRHVATVFAAMNMSGNIGAAVFPIVAGWIVQRTGAWDMVLFIFAGVYVVAAICWLPVRARGTIFDEAEVPPR